MSWFGLDTDRFYDFLFGGPRGPYLYKRNKETDELEPQIIPRFTPNHEQQLGFEGQRKERRE